MRSVALLVAGILMGLTIQTTVAQNSGLVGLNHVAIVVDNLEDAVAFYTQKMGFREAFRNKDDKGQTTLVYVQISRNTFIELQPANPQRRAGLNHLGIHVENLPSTIAHFKQNGVMIDDMPRKSATNALLANITDPWGNRIELAELPPDSLHRKAMESWK